ncbi:MAG: Lrp/AsnC family transcriptional regulator [Candidatus Nanoarchaeia archaeon]
MAVILDDKDKKILEILKNNADFPTRKIAKQTLLPITTVHNRVQKLRREKIIKKYTIDVDYEKTEQNFLVYVLITANLQVLRSKNRTQYDIAKDLRKFQFIERVDIVSGGTDLVAMVRVKDVDEYDKVLLGKIQLIDGIEKTQSLIVIHQHS